MQSKSLNAFAHAVFIIISILSFVPLFIALMISFSNEQDIINFGYRVIPMHFDFSAYKLAFAQPKAVLMAFGISIFQSVVSPVLMIVLCGAFGYALSQQNFRYRKFCMYYILITMLFSGGLIPSYIINTQYLHLGNTLAIYIVLGLVSGWNIILFRTFFSQIPASLIEAAKIDGANELNIFIRIILPMSKPIVGSLYFTSLLGKWNDFSISLYYVTKPELYSLQYFLQQVLNSSSFVKSIYANSGVVSNDVIPVETLKFALAMISCFPVLLAFPYLQKYFSKGMAVGAVKE